MWPAVSANTSVIGGFSSITGRYGSANTNIYIDTQNRDAQKVYVNMATGNNYYSTGETIRAARADSDEITGKVIYFSNSASGILIVGELDKLLQANDVVTGDYTGAQYTVTSVDVSPLKAVSIVTTAVPANTAPDDDFGFMDTITEWPDTL